MYDFDSVGLALSQEPNHVHIHDRYFLQVQNKQGSVMLELLFQFSDVVRLKVTNQTDRGLSTLRILFNLQVPLASPLKRPGHADRLTQGRTQQYIARHLSSFAVKMA
jgi:hypothetical protein